MIFRGPSWALLPTFQLSPIIAVTMMHFTLALPHFYKLDTTMSQILSDRYSLDLQQSANACSNCEWPYAQPSYLMQSEMFPSLNFIDEDETDRLLETLSSVFSDSAASSPNKDSQPSSPGVHSNHLNSVLAND